jgi:hypothetical protein
MLAQTLNTEDSLQPFLNNDFEKMPVSNRRAIRCMPKLYSMSLHRRRNQVRDIRAKVRTCLGLYSISQAILILCTKVILKIDVINRKITLKRHWVTILSKNKLQTKACHAN